MGSGSGLFWCGVMVRELVIPGARSLKDRRAELRSLQERARRMGLSLARMEPPGEPRSATIAVSCIASSRKMAGEMLDAFDRIIPSPAREPAGGWRDIAPVDPEEEGE